MTRTIRLAHLSDVHFGKISHPRIVETLIAEVNAAAMDLVVVSGDLTQRATDAQYREARAMLDAFDAQTLVVPGNHDVRQFWHNPIERLVNSTARFRRFISEDLNPTCSLEGLSVFGMNSAHGLTVKGGLVREQSLEKMTSYFASRPSDDFRILVVHHHLLKNPVLGRTDTSLGAKRAIQAAMQSGVDLVLCGHYHISDTTEHQIREQRIVVATAGTATSSRGRGEQKAINVYNWITVYPYNFSVEERRFDPEGIRFQLERTTEYALANS